MADSEPCDTSLHQHLDYASHCCGRVSRQKSVSSKAQASKMSGKSTSPQTWLITGCSSGFGELFVRQLRAAGDNVIATGRNADTKLAHLRDTGATILDLDVAAPFEEIKEKLAKAWDLYPGGMDVVVNNAGYILSAVFEELASTCWSDIGDGRTNFPGPHSHQLRDRGDIKHRHHDGQVLMPLRVRGPGYDVPIRRGG